MVIRKIIVSANTECLCHYFPSVYPPTPISIYKIMHSSLCGYLHKGLYVIRNLLWQKVFITVLTSITRVNIPVCPLKRLSHFLNCYSITITMLVLLLYVGTTASITGRSQYKYFGTFYIKLCVFGCGSVCLSVCSSQCRGTKRPLNLANHTQSQTVHPCFVCPSIWEN